MNIRNIGSYEIVVCDIDDKRLLEVVEHSSLWKARETADKLMTDTPGARSYYLSKIIDNSKFDKWKVGL